MATPAPGAPEPSSPPRRPGLAAGALRALLVALVAAAAGLLLAPPGTHRLPGPEALGTPAPFTIKADRDYDIADADATARRRAEAAAAQPPVYDLDAGASDEAAARIHAAFELMRAADPASWPARRTAFVASLQVIASAEDQAALGATRFAETEEHALAALAHSGLDGMVVADAQLLPAERERGLTVRVFRDGVVQGERTLLDLAAVRSVDQARDEVVRQAAAFLALEPPRVRAALVRIALAMVRPTLVHNQAESDRRRADAGADVKPVVLAVKRGEKIVEDGERIERHHLVILEGIRAQRKGEEPGWLQLGAGVLVALLVVLLWGFATRHVPGFRPGQRDALLLATLLAGTLALGFVGFAAADALEARFPAFVPPSLHYLVPVAAGAMVVAQVLSAPVGLLFGVAAGLCAGLMADSSATYTLHAIVTSAVAAGHAGGGSERATPFRASLWVGVVGAGLAVAIGLAGGRAPPDVAVAGLAAWVGGAVMIPVVVFAVLPLVEAVFGYVTDAKLAELASLNHPALKELILQAPGTYHHSILMGSMVESAARAIGANPLLAKVCAYYHDVGKIRNAGYFAENQRGESRHAGLAPSMSALIVKRHVTDGLELARQWRLPRPVTDVIAQHHGTRLVGSFWAQAHAAGEGSARSQLDESLFRYTGPKPASREAALVLIADACEASARELERADEAALLALVRRRIEEAFEEGQLDASDLALRDLDPMGRAMVGVLLAVRSVPADAPPRPGTAGEVPPVKLVGEP